MGRIVPGNTIRLGLPEGWMVVPRPAGLTGVDPMPGIEGLAEVEDLDLVGPSGTELTLEASGTDGIVVLVEREGLLSWHLPEPADEGAPGVVVVPVPEPEIEPSGLVSEAIVARIRAVVYRFAAEALAGLAARAVVAVLEGRRPEGPVHLVEPEPSLWLPSADLSHLAATRPRRLLLLLHGTFSSTRGSFAGMADELGSLARGYDLVLGFDHATLGRSPSENAERIAQILVATGWAPERIDLVAYSRGGLVARALLHRLPGSWREAVRTIVYLACPNAGTPLASPERWMELLDRTTNLAAAVLLLARLAPGWAAAAAATDEVLDGIGVLLRALATRALSPADVPGLAAMDPRGPWLRELRDPALPGVRCLGFAANHLPEGAIARLLDGKVDAFMQQDNDLVVPTASVQLAIDTFEMMILEDRQVHHLTLVRAVSSRLPSLLGAAPEHGLEGGLIEPEALPAAQTEEIARAAAVAAVRAALARHPRELPDEVAETLLELEARHPGILEEVRRSQQQQGEVGAPPDRFSAEAEGRALKRTVRDRFDYRVDAVAPTTVGQLWAALSAGGALRVAGSARALSQISDPTRARLLGTYGLGDRWLDPPPLLPSQSEQGLYWCGAGRTLRGIIGDLIEEKRAIANIGAGSFQSIAGAFSSGTHGSGLALGALHTLVASLAVLTFSGGRPVVRFLERDSAPVCDPGAFTAWSERWARRQGLPPGVVELRRDEDAFRAHVLGLGCLGVIVGVALRVVPEYWLSESRQPTTWKLAKHGLLEAAGSCRHFELLLNPWPDGQANHRCLVIRREVAEVHEESGARPFGMWLASEGIARGTVGLLMESAIRDPFDRLPGRVNASIEETIVARYVARWDQVLRLNLNVASLTGEYGVPAETSVEAIDALLALCRERIASARAWLETHPRDLSGMWRKHPVPAGPIAVRFVAADDVLLSPMNGRASAMLEFHHPGSWELDARMVAREPDDDGGRASRYRAYHEGRKALMREAELLLEARHQGRVHWGLYHTLDGARAAAVYPGFSRWLEIYEEANRTGAFNGRITAALGLDRPSRDAPSPFAGASSPTPEHRTGGGA